MTTGQKIQTLRKRQGMTQEQLAQRLGVSRQAVSRWELDEVLPETANLLPLSRALGVSVDSLLDPAAEAGIILVQGLWLCLWLYLLLLVVYFLAAGILYLHQRRPPQ